MEMISKLGFLVRACFCLLWPVRVSLFAWLSCFASCVPRLASSASRPLLPRRVGEA